jgi:glyoxylase-like metal-dependent hydrolase (beta-lactamase superfamily II)
MLEDNYTDIISKALRGHALTLATASQLAGLSDTDVQAFMKGDFSETIARYLSEVLDLKTDALIKHPYYLPDPLCLTEVQRLDLPFEGGQVNAWLIQTKAVAILFDTGYLPSSCTAALNALNAPRPDPVFITHAHRDHTGGLSEMLASGSTLYGWDIKNARPLNPGDVIRCGPLTIRACDLSGHAMPALGYHIEGLTKPVLVTGDALFAGSMGGCASPLAYQNALRTLKEVLTTLPDSTVLLPGHGPATTLGEERVSNPFL